MLGKIFHFYTFTMDALLGWKTHLFEERNNKYKAEKSFSVNLFLCWPMQ